MSQQPVEETQRRMAVQRFFDLHPQQMPTANMYEVYDLCQSRDPETWERGMRRFGGMMSTPQARGSTQALRDQIAMAALMGLLANVGPGSRAEIVESAWQTADAMMERRNK